MLKFINDDCLNVLATMEDCSIDMILTSPPYDDLRSYNGYSFNFEGIAKELYRVLDDGGVMVWVVNDAVKNGSESGTSFKQALYFKEIGFKLHDTMIFANVLSTCLYCLRESLRHLIRLEFQLKMQGQNLNGAIEKQYWTISNAVGTETAM